jgi:hypothetical protein
MCFLLVFLTYLRGIVVVSLWSPAVGFFVSTVPYSKYEYLLDLLRKCTILIKAVRCFISYSVSQLQQPSVCVCVLPALYALLPCQ